MSASGPDDTQDLSGSGQPSNGGGSIGEEDLIINFTGVSAQSGRGFSDGFGLLSMLL